jgi:hypothetical protein
MERSVFFREHNKGISDFSIDLRNIVRRHSRAPARAGSASMPARTLRKVADQSASTAPASSISPRAAAFFSASAFACSLAIL